MMAFSSMMTFTIQTGASGAITLNGTASGATLDVTIEGESSSPANPVISAGGALAINAYSGGGIYLDSATVTAASATLGDGTTGNFSSVTSGALDIYQSTITLSGGDFNAFGKGNSDLNSSGVAIDDATIDTEGGSINLTGQAVAVVYVGSNQGEIINPGVAISDSTIETAAPGSSATTGGIAIYGNGSPGDGVTLDQDLIGVGLDNSVVTVVNGALSIKGYVDNGIAEAVVSNGQLTYDSGAVIGVEAQDGTVISSTGTGSVAITGDTTGVTAGETTPSSGEISNVGVDLSGYVPNGANAIRTSIVSAAGGLGITITGSAGSIDNSPAGADIQTPEDDGIRLTSGLTLNAGTSAPITLTGTGGDDLNGASAGLSNEHSRGISLSAYDGGSTGDLPNVSVTADTGLIKMTGAAGNSIDDVSGISIESNTGATSSVTSTAGNITLKGTVPNQTVVQLGTTDPRRWGGRGGYRWRHQQRQLRQQRDR